MIIIELLPFTMAEKRRNGVIKIYFFLLLIKYLIVSTEKKL